MYAFNLEINARAPSFAPYYICGIDMYVEHNAPTEGTKDGARISSRTLFAQSASSDPRQMAYRGYGY